VDIAIVGAGPAGARAAWVLARQGARVTIFDASHPREKPCGGGVTGRALALVADAVDVARVPSRRIHAARFVDASGGRSVTVPLGGDALVVAGHVHPLLIAMWGVDPSVPFIRHQPLLPGARSATFSQRPPVARRITNVLANGDVVREVMANLPRDRRELDRAERGSAERSRQRQGRDQDGNQGGWAGQGHAFKDERQG
jgi:glycine/D-amino acid oxidase-like deaminating enzyme